MRDYLDQVRRASDAHLYYLALEGALVVPDMCGAMESQDGRATKQRYIDWFDKYVAHKYVAGFRAVGYRGRPNPEAFVDNGEATPSGRRLIAGSTAIALVSAIVRKARELLGQRR